MFLVQAFLEERGDFSFKGSQTDSLEVVGLRKGGLQTGQVCGAQAPSGVPLG